MTLRVELYDPTHYDQRSSPSCSRDNDHGNILGPSIHHNRVHRGVNGTSVLYPQYRTRCSALVIHHKSSLRTVVVVRRPGGNHTWVYEPSNRPCHWRSDTMLVSEDRRRPRDSVWTFDPRESRRRRGASSNVKGYTTCRRLVVVVEVVRLFGRSLLFIFRTSVYERSTQEERPDDSGL